MGRKANPTHRDGPEQQRNNLLWGDLRLHFWAIPPRSHEAVLCWGPQSSQKRDVQRANQNSEKIIWHAPDFTAYLFGSTEHREASDDEYDYSQLAD